MPQEPARDAERDCLTVNGAEHSTATMPAGNLRQDLGQTNYPGQTGRFMRVFALVLSLLLRWVQESQIVSRNAPYYEMRGTAIGGERHESDLREL